MTLPECSHLWCTADPTKFHKFPVYWIYIFFFFDSPEEVASGVIQLIEDESYNAAVMTVTKTKGIEILEKWTPRLRKSNL